MSERIIIFTDDNEGMRGNSNDGIPVELFQKEAQDFYDSITSSLSNLSDNNDEFKLSEITINAEVSASGKIGLLGIGVQGGMKGSLSFKLTRT